MVGRSFSRSALQRLCIPYKACHRTNAISQKHCKVCGASSSVARPHRRFCSSCWCGLCGTCVAGVGTGTKALLRVNPRLCLRHALTHTHVEVTASASFVSLPQLPPPPACRSGAAFSVLKCSLFKTGLYWRVPCRRLALKKCFLGR